MKTLVPKLGAQMEALRERHLGALIGLRPPKGQHTTSEASALARNATGRSSVVEIGVAEGVSAAQLRIAMNPRGVLWLIDPYSTHYPISAARTVAKRTVRGAHGARVVWIRQLSHTAAVDWHAPIDYLFIDGDHSEQACERDWLDWSTWVVPGGIVAFHDSAIGETSAAKSDWGPVCVVNRMFKGEHPREHNWTISETIDSITFVRRSTHPDTER